ncbi:hypothetical protein JWJ88_19150 [Paracoccus methylovorus]|uniref:Glycosyltransferase family 2 protein n=1 Tax=Paracoccus methylovorus TaxID=2812658 RepID=A0ABX7JNI2_9RHOB|nr:MULTISPECIES: hypothetical protein [Paracoccus]QRZ15061.1 hypothetical protein JWJ88_19150 [Paracoccus methylovorus]
MRLSATINFFDGGELLLPMLRNIRPVADHISIVTQEVSNFGNRMSPFSIRAVDEASRLGLADDVLAYVPDLNLKGGRNEFLKRRAGIECARLAGADHVIFCDVDEFYETNLLASAKEFIAANQIDFSTARICSYYVKPTWRLTAINGASATEDLVPFICRLTDATSHEFDGWYPVGPVDPTRRIHLSPGKHYIFPAADIIMHHMTGIRWNIEEKLTNSSHNDSSSSIARQRFQYAHADRLVPGRNLLDDGTMIHIEPVKDIFGLTEQL